MAVIFKLFFMVVGFFVLMTFVSFLAVALKIRGHLKTSFTRAPRGDHVSPDKGSVIEGEYRVLDEKEKK